MSLVSTKSGFIFFPVSLYLWDFSSLNLRFLGVASENLLFEAWLK